MVEVSNLVVHAVDLELSGMTRQLNVQTVTVMDMFRK